MIDNPVTMGTDHNNHNPVTLGTDHNNHNPVTLGTDNDNSITLGTGHNNDNLQLLWGQTTTMTMHNTIAGHKLLQ